MSLSRPTQRSRRSAGAALAAAGAVALLLSGCAGGVPTASPSPSADAAEPIFASDEEALAAAESGYSSHLALVDQVTASGGVDVSRLREVATSSYAENLTDSLGRLQESGTHTAGDTRFDSVGLIERFETEGVATVSVYLCLDVTDVRVVDAGGQDVTPPDRRNRAPIQVELESGSAAEPTQLVVSGAQSWAGDDFC
ncbi:hypothetical protein JOE59_000110 [Agromyces cerinus]|uniref:hypothetical protein n=1 Tax=Agromyces cerinus TaxID=33878 RepID=UPI0019569CA1|nr:hypothetical protein [Agromyces cerinus]MBM7829405.1 hypothetical protein [Agromyces cerinus]